MRDFTEWLFGIRDDDEEEEEREIKLDPRGSDYELNDYSITENDLPPSDD